MRNVAVQGQGAEPAIKRSSLGLKGIKKAMKLGWMPLAVLAFLSLLACPASSSAEVHEYGPKYQRYALDLPQSWAKTAQSSNDGTLMVQSPDKKSVICVRICPREGRSARALARQAAGRLSVSSMVRRDDSAWILYVTSENIRLSNIIQTMDEGVLVITVSGENEQTEAILASLHPTKQSQ